MEQTQANKTNYGALTTLTTVFFFWGFIAAGNSVFIPFCKHYFHLDQFQSQLIDFAFYSAYYLGALVLFIVGSNSGKDIVGHWGYKKSIVYGLLFSALGAVAMIVSVYMNVFSGMLFGLFIVALGFSLQQTSANPFMIALGDEASGSTRINLGGAVNSLGTSIGPLVVALALFGTTTAISDEMIASLSLSKVTILYACVGLLFLGTAALFGFSKKVPSGKSNELMNQESIESSRDSDSILDDGIGIQKTETTSKSHDEGKAETAKKAMVTLLVITGLLTACFAPVFNSYRSTYVKELNELQHDLELVSLDENGVALATLSETQLQTKKDIELNIEKIRQPLENIRVIGWVGGLVVILGGLLFAHSKGKKEKVGWGAMQYPQLVLGMLAIFVYVGVEVAIGSNLGELLKQKEFGGFGSSEIAPYIAMYWGSLMIGRWAGSITAFKLDKSLTQILRFIVPIIAFGIVLGVTKFAGYNIDALYWYIVCVLIQVVAFYVTNDKPTLTLFVFGILGALATVIGLTTTGITAIYAFLSAGLFCSIMWPCIFSLSLAGLGKYQSQGSGFLVMMILGGAIIPPLQGKLSDVMGIQPSFIVGTVCFVYLAFFALYVKRLLKSQGISFDENVGGGH